MSDATPPAGFGRPDLTAFARLDGLGLSVTGQRLEPDRAVLACRVVEPDQWCRRCGSEGAARDTVIRRLAHEPMGWRPTVLEVVVRRYRCADCGHVWRHTRRGDKYVTVIIDLTPVRDGAGPARLLDMVEGRSKAAFKTWLADRDDAFRDAVEVVAMDGFTGFKTAAAEPLWGPKSHCPHHPSARYWSHDNR